MIGHIYPDNFDLGERRMEKLIVAAYFHSY